MQGLGKSNYPKYRIKTNSAIFPTRSYLFDYFSSLEVADWIDVLLEDNKLEEALSILQDVYAKVTETHSNVTIPTSYLVEDMVATALPNNSNDDGNGKFDNSNCNNRNCNNSKTQQELLPGLCNIVLTECVAEIKKTITTTPKG